MNKHEEKVIAMQTKNWQPLMNKLSSNSRKQKKRLMRKRIRKYKNKNQSGSQVD